MINDKLNGRDARLVRPPSEARAYAVDIVDKKIGRTSRASLPCY